MNEFPVQDGFHIRWNYNPTTEELTVRSQPAVYIRFRQLIFTFRDLPQRYVAWTDTHIVLMTSFRSIAVTARNGSVLDAQSPSQ